MEINHKSLIKEFKKFLVSEVRRVGPERFLNFLKELKEIGSELEATERFNVRLKRARGYDFYDGLSAIESRLKGAEETKTTYSTMKSLFISEAAKIWKGKSKLRIGKVVSLLHELPQNKQSVRKKTYRVSKRIIRSYLIEAHKGGKLAIPPNAQKAGPPPKISVSQ